MPHGKEAQKQTLDRKSLVTEATALMKRAEPRVLQLDAQKRESSQILAEMNAPDFWKDAPHALAAWDERDAAEGASSVWLQLRSVDALTDSSEWLAELCEMEVAWCRRLNLAAEVVAVGFQDDAFGRVVLEVEGPGAASYLAMEDGVHRLHRAKGSDLRVRIDVIAQGATRDEPAPRVVRTKKKHAICDRLGFDASFAGTLRAPERGVVVEMCGHDPQTFARLLADLQPLENRASTPTIARSYADSGSGARDPRTGAVVPRYKDVMRGRLEPLLQGFRESPPTGG